MKNNELERLKRYRHKKGSGGTVVKGIRAQPRFFDLLDEVAGIELTTRNELICQVMTAYCTEVLNNGEVESIERSEQ